MHRLTRKAAALLPNIITLVAMIFGLTAIRLAYEGQFGPAVYAILIAAALDFADGLIARRLSVQSPFGAELDSLADLVNFGVAPALLLYQREMQHLGDLGWGVSSAYVLATGLRLARFNTKLKAADPTAAKTQFEGIPSTFAAVAVLILNKAAQNALAPPFTTAIAAASMLGASALMLSSRRVPTLGTLFSSLRSRAARSNHRTG